MIDGLYTNRNTEGDFFINALEHYRYRTPNVYIASAFFTDNTIIKDIAENNGMVRLIVRLGFPTNPKALRELLGLPGVEIRYFTNPSFHPKLYIFGDQIAFVGSANLTRDGQTTNQEIMVGIPSQDNRFDKLIELFQEYWQDSKVLDLDTIIAFDHICQKYDSLSTDFYKCKSEILAQLGDIVSRNITREDRKTSKEDLFIDSYAKSYQECVTAFNRIKSVYLSLEKRKIPEDQIPLRIEIDQFINFIRENHAPGETWHDTPIQGGEAQENIIRSLILNWHETEWSYLDETIVTQNWPKINRVFSSKDAIANSSDEELFDALTVLHSFFEGRRFKAGGLPTLKELFFKDNDAKKIRGSLTHLIFGSGNTVKRMYDLIFNDDYKLRWFGRANTQELVGWLSREELPVVNGRTTKVLRYLGFDVVQL